MLNLTKQQLEYISNDIKTSELFYIIKPNVINLLKNNYKISNIYKFIKMELPDINIKYNTFYKLVKRNIIDVEDFIKSIDEDKEAQNKNEPPMVLVDEEENLASEKTKEQILAEELASFRN